MRAVLAKLERIEAEVERRGRVLLLAIVLELAACPGWAEALDSGRCVRLIGGEPAERRRALSRLRRGQPAEAGVVVLEYRPGASRFIVEVVSGEAAEVACWGARGDRKTSAALGALVILADLHREARHAGPLRVMVPTDSHVNHELKLCRTLVAPHWAGIWSLRDDRHLGVLTVSGEELAHLDLFGAGDPGAMDRLRGECHVMWCEEVAPAALEGGLGVTLDAWSLGLTSIRLPGRRPVAMMTSNMPDSDHWAWQRFQEQPHPSTVSVRIPAGESASPEDRARWAVALQNRPDLMARLLAGEPGSVLQGPQVAKGFNPATHVAPGPLQVARYAELWLGWDSAPNAHTHAVVIGQRVGMEVRVYAGLVGEETALKQFLEAIVLPWFGRRAAWAVGAGGRERLHHRYDPAMDTEEGGDADQNPVLRLRRALGGSFRPGAVDWAARSGPMLSLLNQGNGRGGMALQIDPGEDTALLRRALTSRWHYAVTRGGTVIRDLPAKPNHPHEDLGDAFCYFVGGLAPSLERDPDRKRPAIKHAFSILDYDHKVPEFSIVNRTDWREGR